MLADPQISIRVDSPRQLDPELIFFPDLTRIEFSGVFACFSLQPCEGPQNRLPERDPAAIVRLLTLDIVPLRGVAHRQY